MRLTYDKSVDAAYIDLTNGKDDRRSDHMYACDPLEVGGMINLDFDDSGRLIGVEVLDASLKLPLEMLTD